MYNYDIFDAHCDTLCMLVDNGGDIIKNSYNADKTRMLEYKSYTQVFACFIAPEYRDNAMMRFNRLADCFHEQNFSGITPILSVEGGEMIKSLEDLESLKSRGVRCIALTWNNSNHIAGGADEPDTGLSVFGKSVIKKMNELDILIDVSHLNDKSFYDIVNITDKPIIATHSNSRYICSHRRNLTDEMFNIIRESGGCTGINLYPPFVNGTDECTVSDVIRHIEHFLDIGGEDAIGIGADFDGTENILPYEIKGCGELYKLLDALNDRTIIEKISHKNFKRVFGG